MLLVWDQGRGPDGSGSAMKRIFFYLVLILFAVSAFAVRPALAQSGTPPTGSPGEIRGTIINRNTGQLVTEGLDVMVHVVDQNFEDNNTLKSRSEPDGSFVFKDVPFSADLQYAVMAVYKGVSYYSNTVPADLNSLKIALEVPVYETTKDFSAVQVDQMHVLLDVSPDGLETREVYIVSNLGQQTVKDAFDLGNNQFAALQFPLPTDADYISFQPTDTTRFIELDGAFADTNPIVPGAQTTQFMVSYVVPFSGERTYSYTAPVSIAKINFLLPEEAKVSLSGNGLAGPEPTTLQDGTSYMVYTYSDVKAGQTLNISLSRTATNPLPLSAGKKNNNLLAIAGAFLGFGVIGVGFWWWQKSNRAEEDEDASQSDESTLDEILDEIAQLDDTYAQQGLSIEEYQAQRHELLQEAKRLS